MFSHLEPEASLGAINGSNSFESLTRSQEILNKVHRLIGKVALTIGITVIPATGVYMADAIMQPSAALAESDTYPDADATDCSATYGIYAWCKGNPATWLSSRGYGYRNCTDWAAYRVSQLTGLSVGKGMGNAADWDMNGKNARFTVDQSPEIGDVAQNNNAANGLGHVGVVEEVNKDKSGKITSIMISQYNGNGNGSYTSPLYYPDANGAFWLASEQKWDNFIDINGTSDLPAGAITSTSFARSESMRAADFHGDGFDDIYASGKRGDAAQNEIVYRGGNWLGAGALWATPPDSAIKFADSLNLTADINGDGKDDLITITNKDGEGAPNIQWQKSNGSSFETPLHVGTPSLIARNTRWATGDVTGDGKDDLIAFSKRGDAGINMFVFRSLTSWLGAMEFWGNTSDNVPFLDTRMLVGDYNGDGKEDLYAISKQLGRTEPFIYRLKSNGQNFEVPVLTAIPGWRYEEVNFTALDLDGDGRSDLLASARRGDTAPNLVTYLSDGGTGYKHVGLWSAPGELKWAEAKYIPADLDNDGDDDLIAIQPSGTNSGNPQLWWVKNNRGSFARPELVGQPGINWGDYRYGS